MVNRVRENVPYDEIQENPHNVNKGTERGEYMLRRSMEKGGAVRGVAVDANGVPIAGNHVIALAKELGIEITMIPTRGETLLVNQRLDLDMSDPGGLAQEMAIMDNRTSEVGLEWDRQELADAQDAGIDLAEMWWPAELAEMEFDVSDLRAEAEEKKRPYYPEQEPVDDPVQPGQTYWCGNHKLVIGDSTKPGDADVMLRAFEQYTGVVCEIDTSWDDLE